MANLMKAQFQRLNNDGTPEGPPLPVMFNPTEYSLTKGAQVAEIAIPGLDSPLLQFVRGQTETMSVDLFFDTTDGGMGDDATSVTSVTDNFYRLVKIERETHAPPICLFTWGGDDFPGNRSYVELANQNRFGFKCIVESIRQRFTLFNTQGVPLRATLSVSLKEYKTLADQVAELDLHSGNRTRSYVVQQRDTLSGIAATLYDDPSQWRAIANANAIDDPLGLTPGQILLVPKIN